MRNRQKYQGAIFSSHSRFGTPEDERTVLFKTISLDGIKPNTNPKTNLNTNPNLNPNPELTLILTPFSCFMLFRAPSSDLQSSRRFIYV